MGDEPVVVIEPVVDPVVDPVVSPIVDTQYFGTDGTLKEGWTSTLAEDIRDEKSLLSYKTIQDLAKSNVMTKKMVGANTIVMPTDASTESEWEAFHIAGGRPGTVADYNLKAPDGFPEALLAQVFPEGKLAAWQDRFFKGGVSKKTADALISEFANDMVADFTAMEQAKADRLTESANALSTEFGAAFDQKMHMGDMAIEEFAGDNQELKESLAYLKNDPNAVKMLVHFGGMLAEGKPPGFSAIPTPSDHQDQIDTLMQDPLYMSGTKQQRMKIAEKIMAIRKVMTPEPANA
jgi:hypothetical protein